MCLLYWSSAPCMETEQEDEVINHEGYWNWTVSAGAHGLHRACCHLQHLSWRSNRSAVTAWIQEGDQFWSTANIGFLEWQHSRLQLGRCHVREEGTSCHNLDLGNRGLVGHISPSLGNLTFLKHVPRHKQIQWTNPSIPWPIASPPITLVE